MRPNARLNHILIAQIEDVDVQRMFAAWITHMVRTYKVDGLRIDTALHVQRDFFPNFVQASGIFATGEVVEAANVSFARTS